MPASPSTCQLSQELIFKLTTIFSTLHTKQNTASKRKCIHNET